MSHIGRLAEAGQAGYQVGRARRQPSADDLYRFRSAALRSAFYRGLQRGLRATAHLEQQRLELETVGA